MQLEGDPRPPGHRGTAVVSVGRPAASGGDLATHRGEACRVGSREPVAAHREAELHVVAVGGVDSYPVDLEADEKVGVVVVGIIDAWLGTLLCGGGQGLRRVAPRRLVQATEGSRCRRRRQAS